MYGSRRHHERIHRGHLDAFRAEALRDALAGSSEGSSSTFFVGASVVVDAAYEVHPVVAVPTSRWDSKPALRTTKVDRYAVVPSFQHSLMRELLRAASDDLGRAVPPEDFSLRWSDSPSRVSRRFMASPRSGSFMERSRTDRRGERKAHRTSCG